MKKITPLLTVDAIEPCLDFWKAFGFEVVAEVPHEDALGFAMLNHGDLTVMYQSTASIAADLVESGAPASLPQEVSAGTSMLFVEVDSIDEALPKLEGLETIVPRRQTFYGMDEIFVRAPCGTVVGLAARTAEEEG